jgi:uncharacterized repeat protein (TIGR03803 family)
MNRKPFLQSLSEGRGTCPLPSRTHPQKLNLAVYTEELTHPSGTLYGVTEYGGKTCFATYTCGVVYEVSP